MFPSSSPSYVKQVLMRVIFPSSPEATTSLIRWLRGCQRFQLASTKILLVSSDTAIASATSAAFIPSGFSQRTCLPARIALIAKGK